MGSEMCIRDRCRDVHKEALPVFSDVNSFQPTSLKHLHDHSNGLAPSRLQLVRYFDINHMRTNMGKKENIGLSFQIFLGVQTLKSLTIRAREESRENLAQYPRVLIDWFCSCPLMLNLERFNEPADLPSMAVLCQLAAKATKLRILGDCPRIRKYVQSEVQRLEAGTQ